MYLGRFGQISGNPRIDCSDDSARPSNRFLVFGELGVRVVDMQVRSALLCLLGRCGWRFAGTEAVKETQLPHLCSIMECAALGRSPQQLADGSLQPTAMGFGEPTLGRMNAGNPLEA